jgi:tetratricopeptide (TPR) repeat protein
MQKKFDAVAYYKGFTLGYMMVAWIVIVHFFKQSELWLIPALMVYLLLSAIIFRGYYFGMVGNSFYFVRKFDKARRYYALAVRFKTTNVPALYNYALDLLHAGKADEALPLLERAERYNTKPIYEKNIPLAIGSCYWVMGEIDKALEIMEKLETDFSYVNVSTLTTIGYLYLLKGDLQKAEEYTQRALDDTPEHAPAWDNMGQIYYCKNDIDKAEENFLKALSYRENMVDSLYYMALIREARGDNKGAYDYFKKASGCDVTALNTVKMEQIQQGLKRVEKDL